MNLASLHDAIAAVAPIEGVSVGIPADKQTWRVAFAAEATDEQKAAAAAVIQAFDVNAKYKRSWTFSEFKTRLTPGEKVALGRLLPRSDLVDADAALLFDFITASSLSLDDPKFGLGLERLVALGVITGARRQALLQPE